MSDDNRATAAALLDISYMEWLTRFGAPHAHERVERVADSLDSIADALQEVARAIREHGQPDE